MGMQDRDYYREHHAQKQGMRYDKRRGIYTKFVRSFRRTTSSGVEKIRVHQVGSDWHWSLKLLLWLAIVVLIMVFFRILKSML